MPIPRPTARSPQHRVDQSGEAAVKPGASRQQLELANISHRPIPLHFVSESGTGRPGGTVRNLIRSHARRNQPQKRAAGASVDKNINRKQEPILVQGQGSNPDGRLARKPIIVTVGNPGLDPFNIIPNGSKHAQSLIFHFEKILRHNHSTLHPREKWLPMALTDPLMLQATLAIAAISRSLLHKQAIGLEVYFHQAETVRVLKDRLNEPNLVITDATICAVGCLMQLENLAASHPGARMHMKGFEALVRTRGGIQELTGFAKAMAIWVDNWASLLLETPPRFPVSIINPLHPALNTITLHYQSKLASLTSLPDSAKETISIFASLQSISSVKEKRSAGCADKLDIENYSETLNLLERRIILVSQSPQLSPPNVTNSIYHLFSNALLLHIIIFLRDSVRGLPLLHLLSSRIRSQVSRLGLLSLSSLYNQYPELILWILMLAGIGGMDSEKGNGRFFAGVLATFCKLDGIEELEGLKEKLGGFLWMELYRTPFSADFWWWVVQERGFEGGWETRRLTDELVGQAFNLESATRVGKDWFVEEVDDER